MAQIDITIGSGGLEASLSSMTSLLNAKITLLTNETIDQATNGSKPSYTLTDRTFDWNGYRAEMMKEISDLTKSIRELSQLIADLEVFQGGMKHIL